jgi:hypothetical protein
LEAGQWLLDLEGVKDLIVMGDEEFRRGFVPSPATSGSEMSGQRDLI